MCLSAVQGGEGRDERGGDAKVLAGPGREGRGREGMSGMSGDPWGCEGKEM